MDDVVKTKLRRRTLLGGSCLCNNTSAASALKGDGVMERSTVGTYTVTLPHKYPDVDSMWAHLNGGTADQIAADITHSNTGSTTVLTITVKDISGAALADVNAVRLNWGAIASGRAP